MIKSEVKNKNVKINAVNVNADFESAKLKLFKLLDEGMSSKKRYIADEKFWADFMKI